MTRQKEEKHYPLKTIIKMQIEHLGLWVQDLEAMKDFYLNYFDVVSGPKYTNGAKHFTSYFINFGEGRTRLELMTNPNIQPHEGKRGFGMGLAHFAISVGGKDKVDALTERLRKDNFTIFSEPRTTGDGYYESVVLDPEGNYVEISA
jgi:lactoylglutathione lyase